MLLTAFRLDSSPGKETGPELSQSAAGCNTLGCHVGNERFELNSLRSADSQHRRSRNLRDLKVD
jgi:hypothetical protein